MDDTLTGQSHPHVMPFKVLVAVWAALVVLTLATVAASQVDLGPLNIWIAMGIATVKAILVILFFMHLIVERGFNAVILLTAFVFVFLFLSLTLLDSVQYHPELIPGYQPLIR